MIGWPSDNVFASILSGAFGAVAVVAAGRIKRAATRDVALLTGYDRFTGRLSSRVDTLERELDRRESECRRRLDEAGERLDQAEERLRLCEEGRAILRRRLDEIDRRMPPPGEKVAD